MESISVRLKKAMNIRNLSQADLARRTNISKGALSSYISGRYVPKRNNILLLAEVLDVNEEWLTGADVPMEASLISIIDQRLNETGMTLEELAGRARVSLHWLQHIHTFIPGELQEEDTGYDRITRVAKVLDIPGSILRRALARQEIPLSGVYPAPSACTNNFTELHYHKIRPGNTKKYHSQAPEILIYFNLLNDTGRQEATKRVRELTELPRYAKEKIPCINAAHADDYAGAPEELKNQEEAIMDDENF